MEPYMKAAHHHAQLLQQNEKASSQVEVIGQGKEDAKFWKLFFSTGDRHPAN